MSFRGLLDKPRWHRSILVTDSDAELRRELASVLEPEGFSVYQASAGGEAIEMVRCAVVDVVILNMLLPDFDGPDALSVIRRYAPPLPAIFFAERLSKEMRIKAMSADAFAALEEPLHPEVLRDTVWRLVHRYYGPPERS